MTNLLRQIINQGVGLNAFDHKSRRIIYSNIIYLTLPVVYIIFVALEFDTYLGPIESLDWDHFVFIVEIAMCLSGIYFNRIGQSLLGRLFFLVSWPFFLHLLPIWHQHTPSDYYLAFPLGLIFHALLIQLMISIHQERIIFWFMLIGNFILLLFSVDLLVYSEDILSPDIVEMVKDDIFLLDIVLYWLLFSMVVFLLIRAIDESFEIISSNQKIIGEQKDELEAINEELVQSNESLLLLNNKVIKWNEQLEMAVAQRTREIENQNERLLAYAYLNAHKLRAPFCRIKGLNMLRGLTPAYEMERIDLLLNQSVQELELVIQEIQQTVHQPGTTADLK